MKEFFITEFWVGPDGGRRLWRSEWTERDPTGRIRAVPPAEFFPGETEPVLIITFPVRQWANPHQTDKEC